MFNGRSPRRRFSEAQIHKTPLIISNKKKLKTFSYGCIFFFFFQIDNNMFTSESRKVICPQVEIYQCERVEK